MSDKIVFIKPNNNWEDIYQDPKCNYGHNSDMIYNAMAILFFIILVLSMKHKKTSKQITLLFKNDLFKILYLSLLLFIDIERYPIITLILVCVFLYIMFFMNTEENMENITFLKKNIFND